MARVVVAARVQVAECQDVAGVDLGVWAPLVRPLEQRNSLRRPPQAKERQPAHLGRFLVVRVSGKRRDEGRIGILEAVKSVEGLSPQPVRSRGVRRGSLKLLQRVIRLPAINERLHGAGINTGGHRSLSPPPGRKDADRTGEQRAAGDPPAAPGARVLRRSNRKAHNK